MSIMGTACVAGAYKHQARTRQTTVARVTDATAKAFTPSEGEIIMSPRPGQAADGVYTELDRPRNLHKSGKSPEFRMAAFDHRSLP